MKKRGKKPRVDLGLRVLFERIADAIAKLDGETSIGDELSEISQAFHRKFGRHPDGSYIDDVWLPHSNIFDEHIIAEFGRDLFKIEYEITEDGVEFAPPDEWVKMEKSFRPVQESFFIRFSDAKSKAEGKEWEVTIIGPESDDDIIKEGKETFIRSQNDRLYSIEALEASVEIWEDAKVFDNHLTDEEFAKKQGMRSVKDEWVGTIVDPFWDAVELKVKATLKIIDEALRKKLKEANDADVLDTIGLSIDALGEGVQKSIKALGGKVMTVVEKLVKAISVDIVADPAAGGRLTRMVAATREVIRMDPKEIQKLIEEAVKKVAKAFDERLASIEEALEPEGSSADETATKEAIALAAEHKVDLATAKIEGTGEEGIITEADVQKHVDKLAEEESGDPDPDPDAEPDVVAEALKKIEDEAAKVFTAIEDQAKEREDLRKASKTLAEKLTDSGLPVEMKTLIEGQFSGIVFEEKELDEAIKGHVTALVRLSESGNVIVPVGPRIKLGGLNELDRYELAFLRLVAGPTTFNEIMAEGMDEDNPYAAVRHSESVKRFLEDGKPALPRVRKLSEWYTDLTGDYEGMGRIVKAEQLPRLVEANITTASVTSIVKNTLNLLLAADYSVRERWWEPIVRQEDVDTLDDSTLVRVHGISNLSSLNEGQTYTELDWEDEEETASYKKRGNYIGITLETFLQDKLNVLRSIPMRLSNSWYNTISALVSNVFTLNSAVGPVLADTGALFNATALTTVGGHANLGTTALAYASFLAARTAMMKQTDQPLGVGRRETANRPNFLLIPVDLLGIAEQLRNSELVPTQIGGATAAGEFQTVNSVKGAFNIIEVPDWSDTNNWAAIADPRQYPAIFLIWLRGRRTPELFSAEDERGGAMFSNDEIRMKIRMFSFRYSATYDSAPVADWRGLYKANVA